MGLLEVRGKASIVILRDVEEVFDHISSPAFVQRCLKPASVDLSDRLHAGFTARYSLQWRWLKVPMLFEVTNYERPWRFHLRISSVAEKRFLGFRSRFIGKTRASPPSDIWFDLASAAGGTRLTHTVRQQLRSLLILPLALAVSPLMSWRVRRDLRRLKRELESEQAAAGW